MTHLFDASSLVDALLTGRVEVTFDQRVLDLTPYEAGNALWKNHHLREEISEDRFGQLVALLAELLGDVHVEPVRDLDLDETMTLALEESITFYDAAYVVCASREDVILVTEDRELATVAGRHVEATDLDRL